MAFPLGPNMAEEAARAHATQALEAGIERQEPEPEPKPEPVAAKSAKFNPKAFGANQPKCPKCGKTVYFAERVVGLNGTEWHKGCLRCESCEKTLGSVAEITDQGRAVLQGVLREELRSEGTRTSGRRDDLSHGVESYDRRAM